jgi:hypothetical protein
VRTPAGPDSGTGWWRRSLSALALVLVGALLGAGVTAWQTDSLPFVSSPCWDSVNSHDLDEALGGWDTDDSDVRPSQSDQAALTGQCRITSHDGDTDGRQIDVRVHQLSGLRSHNIAWSDEFLDSRLTPLGDGLVGMASDTRAWVALPSSCIRPGGVTGLGVVDVSMGEGEPSIGTTDDDRAATHRMALARTAVDAANGAVAELGCPEADKLHEPGASAPLPNFQPLPVGDDLCGLAGLRLPKPYVRKGNLTRTSAGGSRHVRTCDIAVSPYAGQPELRLQTIEDPSLIPAFQDAYLNGGPSIESTGAATVDGTYNPTVAALRVDCGSKGAVAFIAQERAHERDYTFIRKTFPAYVSAEAERLGCGTLEIQLPG